MDDIFGSTIQAIRVLSPSLQFTLSAKQENPTEVDWDSFIINDSQESEYVPTIEEIEAKRIELLNAAPMRKLREERNKRLLESDWIAAKSYENNEQIPNEWKIYRQALRDITISFTSLDNVVWPNIPE